MTDALATLDALLQGASAGAQSFAPNSRYYGVPTTTTTLADGRTVCHLTRRFVPPPESFSVLQSYRVVQNDRLDMIAAKFFGDPLLYWRIADANAVVDPNELTDTLNRRVLIAVVQG